MRTPRMRDFAAPLAMAVLFLLAAAPLRAQQIVCNDYNSVGPVAPANTITIDDVHYNAAWIASAGSFAQVSVDHYFPFGAPDADFDLEVPWSENNLGGNTFAEIVFDPVRYGAGVQRVEIEASHTNYLEMQAYDASGAAVGLPVAHTAGQGNPQLMVMTGANLIRRVEIRGSEIVLTKNCFELAATGTLDCIDIAGLPSGLSAPSITVDKVVFTAGQLPGGGAVVDLQVQDMLDAPGNGRNEIGVPWSEPGATRFAAIHFPAPDFGIGPKLVEVVGGHFNFMELRAYDRTGALVGVVAHPGPQGALRVMTLASAGGIRRIDIVGSEIGIEDLCYEECPPGPNGGYTSAWPLPLGSMSPLFTVDNVDFIGSIDPAGAPMDLLVTDQLPAATPDGVPEFFVGWSNPGVGSSRTMRVRFPGAFFGEGPTMVEVVCAPSTTLDLVAYDKVGNVVDAKSHTAGALNLEVIPLTGGNIREVELIGSQFWIQEVCWDGVELPEKEFEYIDITGQPVGVAGPAVTIDGVRFRAGVLPSGATADLFFDDNFDLGGNGLTELNVPWSENTAARFAQIIFPPAEFGRGVLCVDIKASHSFALSMRAYDRFGNLVDFDWHPGPQMEWRRLVLSSPRCIRRIDIVGAEVGIEELCLQRHEEVAGSGYTGSAGVAPVGSAAHLWVVDDVEVEGAFDLIGNPLDVEITENLPTPVSDGMGEFFFGWSDVAPAPSQTARLRFPAAAFGDGPGLVEVLCAPSTTLDLVAYDKTGAVLMTQSHTAGPLNWEGVVLNGGGNKIREIELIGTQFWVGEICWAGVEAVTAIDLPAGDAKLASLAAPSPNPFNPRTRVQFTLRQGAEAQLDVLDLRGRVVRQLAEGWLSAGEHSTQWNGLDESGARVASGTYLLRLRAGQEVHVQRATLVK